MSSQYTHRAIIVVTAADQAQANQDALAFDPSGGAQTFRVGLSASGNAPATHYWSSSACTDAEWAAFQALDAVQAAKGAGRTRWLFDGLTTTPDAVLAAMGLKRVVVAD